MSDMVLEEGGEFDLDIRVVEAAAAEAADMAGPQYPYTWTCPDESCVYTCISCWAC